MRKTSMAGRNSRSKSEWRRSTVPTIESSVIDWIPPLEPAARVVA